MAIVPGYYNPVSGQPYTMGSVIPAQSYSYAPQPMQIAAQSYASMPYMIQVDGENAAKAWQMPGNVAPGTVIPLWDVDGVHVYFRSVDGYGRLNPTRKARVVFEEEVSTLSDGRNNSNTSQASSAIDPNQFATKADFESLREDIRMMMDRNHQNSSRQQSGNYSGQQNQQRGGNNNT